MKKINNKVLVIGLVALIAIFVMSRVFRSPRLESNLRKALVEIDTSKVTEVRIANASGVTKLVKEGTQWVVSANDKRYTADAGAVKSIIGTIGALSAERMVSRKKDKWETYNVGEQATNVSVYYGNDLEAEIKVGKTGFDRTPGATQFNGGGVEPYTYTRVSNEDEVYVVNGFLESAFNRGVNEWRDHKFMRVLPELVDRITFNYPDSSFVLEKKDTVWMMGAQQANKDAVFDYIRALSRKNLATFSDGNRPEGAPQLSVEFTGAGGSLAKAAAWKTPTEWIHHSALQPDVYFKVEGASPDADVFVGAKRFR